MTPAIEHDGCDIALGIESMRAEQARHLPSYTHLEFRIGSCEKARACRSALYGGGQAGNGQPHIERQHCRPIRMQRYIVPLAQHVLSQVAAVTEAIRVIEPTARRDVKLVEEAPLPQCHVDD